MKTAVYRKIQIWFSRSSMIGAVTIERVLRRINQHDMDQILEHMALCQARKMYALSLPSPGHS
jgi:hypothetical protein